MPSLFDRMRTALKGFRTGPADVSDFLSGYGYIGPAGQVDPTGQRRNSDYIASSVGVYACADVRANALAGLDLKFYKGQGTDRTVVQGGPLNDLIAKVNPFWTWHRLKLMTELSLCLDGEAFWVLERGAKGTGTPTEIWWAHPEFMRPVPHKEKYLVGFVYEHNGVRLEFAPGEVIWFRYPDPRDEFGALSPLAAAALSIETARGAMLANRAIFDKGFSLAGLVTPKADSRWTREQIQEVEALIQRRMTGVGKAHRLAVLSQALDVQQLSITPKDAEYIQMLRWTLGDICRAYKVPPPMVQDFERATYSNVEQAYQAFWGLCMVPEAALIASEITEQLLPMFPGEADTAEFDLSRVKALQDDAGQVAETMSKLWTIGVPLDRLLGHYMPHLLPAPGEEPTPPPATPDADAATSAGKALALVKAMRQAEAGKAIAYGSTAHELAWKRLDARARRHETKFARMTVEHLERQRQAALARLPGAKALHKDGVEYDPFDRAEWDEELANAAGPLILQAVTDAGNATADEVQAPSAFDVERPEVQTFISERAQRFAERVNETTWTALKTTVSEGMRQGEGIDKLSERVNHTMGDRIRSDAETIARTETIGALNGGALEAAKQSGVVKGKGWLAEMGPRTRGTHAHAHERYQAAPIPLDDNFHVGAGAGPCPGSLGVAEEDINCRCTLTWEVDLGDES